MEGEPGRPKRLGDQTKPSFGGDGGQRGPNWRPAAHQGQIWGIRPRENGSNAPKVFVAVMVCAFPSEWVRGKRLTEPPLIRILCPALIHSHYYLLMDIHATFECLSAKKIRRLQIAGFSWALREVNGFRTLKTVGRRRLP